MERSWVSAYEKTVFFICKLCHTAHQCSENTKKSSKKSDFLYFFIPSCVTHSIFTKLFAKMEQRKQQSDFLLDSKLLWLHSVHNPFKHLLS